MEINKKLLMTFKTTDDRKISLSIDDPREDITEGKLQTLSDSINELSKNIIYIK